MAIGLGGRTQLRHAAVLALVSCYSTFTIANAVAATTRVQSFGEWTATCDHDDMDGTTTCGVSRDWKEVSDGLILRKVAVSESGGTAYLNAVISGGIITHGGPLLKVDENQITRAIQLGDPSYDVNASGMKYTYLLDTSLEAEEKSGKVLRVRVPLETGQLDTSFDLSGYPSAKAQEHKWETGKATNN